MSMIDVNNLGLSKGLVDKLLAQDVTSHIDIYQLDLGKAKLTQEETLELAVKFRDGFTEVIPPKEEEPKAEAPKKVKPVAKKKPLVKKK